MRILLTFLFCVLFEIPVCQGNNEVENSKSENDSISIVVINGLVLKVSLVEVKVVKDVVVGWEKVVDIRDDEVAKYKGLTPLIPKKINY